MMEVEKAQARQRDDLIGDFLAVSDHQNHGRLPQCGFDCDEAAVPHLES